MATTTATIAVEREKETQSSQPVQVPNWPKPVGYDPADPATNLNALPQFSSKEEERKWTKQQMVAIFRVFAKHGWADGFNGHVSLRDPVEPDTFWLNPYARHFSTLCVSDLIRVDAGGKYVEGPKHLRINIAGFPIHERIHRERPDINVVVHTHSPHGRAWSCFGKEIEMLTQDCCYFYDDLVVYSGPPNQSPGHPSIVLASNNGEHIAKALGPKRKNIILQSHGLMTCGSTPAEAGAYFIALERACETQILAEAAAANGVMKRVVSDEEAAYTKSWLGTPEVMYWWFQPEYEAVLKETKGEFLL